MVGDVLTGARLQGVELCSSCEDVVSECRECSFIGENRSERKTPAEGESEKRHRSFFYTISGHEVIFIPLTCYTGALYLQLKYKYVIICILY